MSKYVMTWMSVQLDERKLDIIYYITYGLGIIFIKEFI